MSVKNYMLKEAFLIKNIHMKKAIQSKKDLRKRLTQLVASLRSGSCLECQRPDEPQSVKHDEIFFNGQTRKRKRIVLLAKGCSVASCTMCPLPNEALGREEKITSMNLIKQIRSAFEYEKEYSYEIVTVYGNNNFFSDLDISPEAREYIYRQVSQSPARILIVESLPQFISEKKIKEAKSILGKKQLAVAIGLQSANSSVRELAVNSACTRSAFKKAAKLLRENNFLTQVFLMVKPPFMREAEVVNDVLGSIKFLASLAIFDPILCVTRVAPKTLVSRMYKEKLFYSPWLWTVIRILIKSAEQTPTSTPRVAVSELYSANNPGSVCTGNCRTCNDLAVKAIEKFNISRDVNVIKGLYCSCLKDYKKFLINELPSWKNMPMRERIVDFLKN